MHLFGLKALLSVGSFLNDPFLFVLIRFCSHNRLFAISLQSSHRGCPCSRFWWQIPAHDSCWQRKV